jgi:hypothetical protein
MSASETGGIRDTVYVIGAGFSQGFGYPLTRTLLMEAWERLPLEARDQLQRIIEFHHPNFSLHDPSSFPNIEQLLTEIDINLQMFMASRPAEGRFRKQQLRQSRETLLFTIATWFHDLYRAAAKNNWLAVMVNRLRLENAAVISFNWDLVLDHALFDRIIEAESYGLAANLQRDAPVLLTPHGSLNWYQGRQLRHVPEMKRIEIYRTKDPSRAVHAFLPPRDVQTFTGKKYTPLIVPPTYLKDFRASIFRRIWQNCTDVLSTPKRLIFLGYSLPIADWHAQFIFRCGFHNQVNGRIKDAYTRYPPTGPAEVIVVNTDVEATAGCKRLLVRKFAAGGWVLLSNSGLRIQNEHPERRTSRMCGG